MALGLQEAGHGVLVLTAMPNYPKGRIHPAYRGRLRISERFMGANVVRHWLLASHSHKKTGRFLGMASFMATLLLSLPKLYRWKPAYIMVQCPPLPLPLLGWLFARVCKAQLVVNVSDLWPSAIADLGLMNRKSLMYRILDRLETLLYLKAAFVMAQSEEISQHVKSKGQASVLLYRTGADCRVFKAKQHHGRQNAAFSIVYAGVLGYAHNLLATCRHIDFAALGVELHVFGDGHGRKALEDFVAAHPQNGVFLHQPVPFSDVPALLLRHDAALVSQKKKVFGTVPSKAYEAMAAGLPLLFNGSGEGAGIVAAAQCGFVSAPGDFDTLAAHIRELAAMPPESLAVLGKAGRLAVEQHYDRQAQISALTSYLAQRQASEKPGNDVPG